MNKDKKIENEKVDQLEELDSEALDEILGGFGGVPRPGLPNLPSFPGLPTIEPVAWQ